MTSPRNTSNDDPFMMLLTGLPGGIEAQERQGQAQLLNSTTLPTDVRDREAFEALGFTFGDVVPGDDLFCEATLPEGWKREGSDHAMWSYIVDERGFRRVAIFYKAAFYDRSAHMGLQHVGAMLASDFIYGDGPAEFSPPAGLTDEETADLIKEARRYLERAKKYPVIYRDRAPRAQAILEAIEGSPA